MSCSNYSFNSAYYLRVGSKALIRRSNYWFNFYESIKSYWILGSLLLSSIFYCANNYALSLNLCAVLLRLSSMETRNVRSNKFHLNWSASLVLAWRLSFSRVIVYWAPSKRLEASLNFSSIFKYCVLDCSDFKYLYFHSSHSFLLPS